MPPDVKIAVSKDVHANPITQMDGYMLIQQIRSRPTDQGGMILAIALTAYAGEFDRRKAIESGFQAHITKPGEPEELVKAIARLCGWSGGTGT